MARMLNSIAHPCLERRYPYQAFCQSLASVRDPKTPEQGAERFPMKAAAQFVQGRMC